MTSRKNSFIAAVVTMAQTTMCLAQVTQTWTGLSPDGAYFELDGNWSGLMSPGPLDTALFDLPGIRTIEFRNETGDRVNATLSVIAGDVRLKRVAATPIFYTLSNMDVATGRLELDKLTLAISAGGAFSMRDGATVELMGGFADVRAQVLGGAGSVIAVGTTASAAQNTLLVNDGSSMVSSFGYIGDVANSNGWAEVYESPWTLSDDLVVGRHGSGTLKIYERTIVTCLDGWVGQLAGSNGTVRLFDEGTTWTNHRNLTLGNPGGGAVGVINVSEGKLNVGALAAGIGIRDTVVSDADGSDGGNLFIYAGSSLVQSQGDITVGAAIGQSGRVLVSGVDATLRSSLTTWIGLHGTGTLNVESAGKLVAQTLAVGSADGIGTVTVAGAGSLLDLNNTLSINSGRVANDELARIHVGTSAALQTAGVFEVTGGSVVVSGGTLSTAGPVKIGQVSGTTSSIKITGPNALWESAQTISLGSGSVRVEAGGRLVVSQDIELNRTSSTSSVVTVTGAGSTIHTIGSINGRGIFQVLAGGSAQVGGELRLGTTAAGSAQLNVEGVGSALVANSIVIGHDANAGAGVFSGGSMRSETDITCGALAGASGSINVSGTDSRMVATRDLRVGVGGSGYVSIGGGTGSIVGDAVIANAAIGTFVISDKDADGTSGGNLQIFAGSVEHAQAGLTSSTVVGYNEGELGTLQVIGANSLFKDRQHMTVGRVGMGRLDLLSGGKVQVDASMQTGTLASGSAVINVNGSNAALLVRRDLSLANAVVSVSNQGSLQVGDNGVASVPVSTLLVSDSDFNGGILTVGAGASLTHTGNASFGNSFGQGRVIVSGPQSSLTINGVTRISNRGALTIGPGAVATFANPVSGSGAADLIVEGSTSRLALEGGELHAARVMFTGPFTFTSGRFASQYIGCNLVQDGGVLAPMGASIIQSLNLRGGSVEFELQGPGATASDSLHLSGSAQFNGGLNLIRTDDFVPALGTEYALFTRQVNLPIPGTFTFVSGLSITHDLSFAVIYNRSASMAVAAVVSRAGDANLSGTVDFDDLLILAQNYNTETVGRTWSSGDFTGDARTNFDDLLILAQHYQGQPILGGNLDSTLSADWAIARALVPEPGILCPLAALFLQIHRRTRSARCWTQA